MFSRGHAKGRCWNTKSLTELRCIIIFQFIRWDQLGQLDPTIVARKFSAKRQEEVLKRELVSMLTSIHVDNPERLLGAFEPVRKHFTVEDHSDPWRCSGSGPLQEAPGTASNWPMVRSAAAGCRPSPWRGDVITVDRSAMSDQACIHAATLPPLNAYSGVIPDRRSSSLNRDSFSHHGLSCLSSFFEDIGNLIDSP